MLAAVISDFLLATGVSPVVDALEGMRSQLVNTKLGSMTSIASGIAALMCGFAFIKFSHDYLEGHGVTLWSILRPIVLLVMTLNFNSFVASPVHSICNMMTRGMARQTNLSALSYGKTMIENIKKQASATLLFEQREVEEIIQKSREGISEPPKEKNFWKDTWLGRYAKTVGDAYIFKGKQVLNALDFLGTFAITTIVEGLLLLIMKAVLFGQQVLAYINLSLLTLIGPFAFALAIFPGFQGGAIAWVKRYIEVCFWVPIGQLVMWCNYWVLERIGDLTLSMDFGSKWINIIALLVCIMCVKDVPRIATAIISGGGAVANQSVGSAFSTVANVGMMFANLKVLKGRNV